MSEFDPKRRARVGIKLKRQRINDDDWQDWELDELEEKETQSADQQSPKQEQ